MQDLVIATGNAGKMAELQALLSPIVCVSQQELGIKCIEETGLTFIENAILKARHASRLSQKPALADDSGLVVPQLQGQPGIYSARFAGVGATDKENRELLLQKMLAYTERHAYFYCALALVQHEKDPTPLLATGQLWGTISQKPKGTHGFGYDPLFFLTKQQCTMAELPIEIKNTISHRGLALQQLQQHLESNVSWFAQTPFVHDKK